MINKASSHISIRQHYKINKKVKKRKRDINHLNAPIKSYCRKYTDFFPEWYATVGAYFMTAFVLQAAVPLGVELIPYLFSSPLMRALYYPYIRYVRTYITFY